MPAEVSLEKYVSEETLSPYTPGTVSEPEPKSGYAREEKIRAFREANPHITENSDAALAAVDATRKLDAFRDANPTIIKEGSDKIVAGRKAARRSARTIISSTSEESQASPEQMQLFLRMYNSSLQQIRQEIMYARGKINGTGGMSVYCTGMAWFNSFKTLCGNATIVPTDIKSAIGANY